VPPEFHTTPELINPFQQWLARPTGNDRNEKTRQMGSKKATGLNVVRNGIQTGSSG
jgi:hypothetical protein